MHFTHTSMLLYFLVTFSAFTSTQGLNQYQTCANACTAAQACGHQCIPSTPSTTYNAETIDCLCQSGCLCNAEICYQCCEITFGNGTDEGSCPFLLDTAGTVSVLSICGDVSLPFSFSCERNKSKGEDIDLIPKYSLCFLRVCKRMV